jgi:hypothetical protein
VSQALSEDVERPVHPLQGPAQASGQHITREASAMVPQSSLNDDVVGGWWYRRCLVPDEQVAGTGLECLSERQERREWQVL